MLLPVLGCGVVSFAGFVYVGARTRRRSYWILAALYGALGLAALILISGSDKGSAMAGIGAAILLGGWAASLAHAFAVNADYLRWKAAHEDGRLGPEGSERFAAPHDGPRHRPADAQDTGPRDRPSPARDASSREDRSAARYAGPVRPERNGLPVITAPPSQPVDARVDINTADAHTLAQLPGLDPVTAGRIITVRTAYGRFDSLDQMAALVSLPPLDLAGLRPWVIVGLPRDDTGNDQAGSAG